MTETVTRERPLPWRASYMMYSSVLMREATEVPWEVGHGGAYNYHNEQLSPVKHYPFFISIASPRLYFVRYDQVLFLLCYLSCFLEVPPGIPGLPSRSTHFERRVLPRSWGAPQYDLPIIGVGRADYRYNSPSIHPYIGFE